MTKIKSTTIKYTLFAIIGVALFVASEVFNSIDSFWSGMGASFVVISIMRLVQLNRYQKDDSYAEKIDIQNSDERNRFLAEKARGMAFYYFILLAAILAIVLRIVNYDQASSIFAWTVGLLVLIYWLSYQWLIGKY